MALRDSQPHGLTRQQKTGFVLLLVFGVLTVGLGFLQIRNTIYGPFVIRPAQTTVRAEAFLDETARLQRQDTDRDGLSDYEEAEFYGTSRYLPDTDSDGRRDKDEIDQGTDPLCPEGQDCSARLAPPSAVEPALSPLVPAQGGPLDFLSAVGRTLGAAAAGAGPATSSAAGRQVDVQALVKDPNQLRRLLLETGKIKEEQLSKIDDATLLRLAQELAAEGG